MTYGGQVFSDLSGGIAIVPTLNKSLYIDVTYAGQVIMNP
jgi:hypothetical protein